MVLESREMILALRLMATDLPAMKERRVRGDLMTTVKLDVVNGEHLLCVV